MSDRSNIPHISDRYIVVLDSDTSVDPPDPEPPKPDPEHPNPDPEPPKPICGIKHYII